MLTDKQQTLIQLDIMAAKNAHRLAQRFCRMGQRAYAKIARETRDINLRAARQRKAVFLGR